MSWFRCVSALSLCLLAFSSQAAIMMVGTRIVYEEGEKDVTLQVSNEGSSPSIIQSWLDSGNDKSTPEDGVSPFVVTPPITKILPGEGQSLRLVFTGAKDSLPSDRESVFYFNLLEIPSLQEDQVRMNKLVIMTRHRMKAFYRPAGVSGSQEKVIDKLRVVRGYDASGKEYVEVSNPTGFYASFRKADLTFNGKKVEADTLKMIAPYSSEKWFSPVSIPRSGADFHITLINDHGGNQDREFDL